MDFYEMQSEKSGYSESIEKARADQSKTEFVCSKCSTTIIGDSVLLKHYKEVHHIKSWSLAMKMVQSQIQTIVLGLYRTSNPIVTPVISTEQPVAKTKRKYGEVKKLEDGASIPPCKMKKSSKLKKFPTPVSIKIPTELKAKKKFGCAECPCSYSDQKGLNKHVRRVHRKEQNFFCSKCSKGFFTKSYLANHMHVHDETPSFICDECKPSVSFKHENGLKTHIQRKHRKERAYTCHCGKDFATSGTLSQHKRTHFDKNFLCPVCEKAYKSRSGVYSHFKNTHNDGDVVYECHLCPETGDTFTTHVRANLRSHFIGVHSPRNNCFCPECGRGFKLKANLQKHLNDIHLNPLSHHCHLCPRSLSHSSSFRRHVRRHEQGNNYSCFVCQVDFESEKELIQHTLNDPAHKLNWGEDRKARPIEKEQDYSQNLKLILSTVPEDRIKKTCDHKNCIICTKALAVDFVYFQDSYIPVTDNFDCNSENVIYLIICTNPLCCPDQDENAHSLLVFYRYCGQTKSFPQRMNQHFASNSKHNPVFSAHFRSCGEEWLKCVPIAKTLNFQASRNFVEIDIISAFKCNDMFSGGFNYLAGGQYTKIED